MNRKFVIFTIILTIGLMVTFDFVSLFLQSGKLEKITKSIQKFDTLYSQNFRMNQQLLTYSKKLKFSEVTSSQLKDEFLNSAPYADFKVSRDTVKLVKPSEVDAVKLLNTLSKYTNVNVIDISMKSMIPVKYVGFIYKGTFKERVMLENLVVKVYGG